MNPVSVQCRQMRLAFGATEVLKGVDLDVEPGEFFALLGPSGSGKSTLLRLIAGFHRPQSGQLLIDGADVSAKAPWERNVGMVFQSYALWPHLSVRDNVAFGLVERKVDKATLRRKVGAALELVGLSALAERRPNQLSGGQQQRVALARTVVIEPQVLLLDEPLSNLDKALRVQMRQELLAMQRRLGLTTIFVTHDQEEAMTTADRMAVLDQGVVQQVGSPTSLYDAPVNAFVAGFVGTMNLLPCRVRPSGDGRVTVDLERMGEFCLSLPDAIPGDGPCLLSFRPEAVRLGRSKARCADGELCLSGTVEASEFLGELIRIRVRVGEQVVTVSLPHDSGVDAIPAGGAAYLAVDRRRIRLLAE